MEELIKNKKIIFTCLILMLIVFGIYLFSLRNNDYIDIDTENYNFLKNYKSNEFIPIYITDEDMAQKYLNEYKNNMIYDIERAYNSLNKEYREKRFHDLETYKEYVDNIMSLSTYSMEVDKYSIDNISGNKIFNIYDKTGYQYIIKEISIMNYEVYLDEYTVKIK